MSIIVLKPLKKIQENYKIWIKYIIIIRGMPMHEIWKTKIKKKVNNIQVLKIYNVYTGEYYFEYESRCIHTIQLELHS
jgi:hypothetical protein